jgi:hypothetical protein
MVISVSCLWPNTNKLNQTPKLSLFYIGSLRLLLQEPSKLVPDGSASCIIHHWPCIAYSHIRCVSVFCWRCTCTCMNVCVTGLTCAAVTRFVSGSFSVVFLSGPEERRSEGGRRPGTYCTPAGYVRPKGPRGPDRE